MLLIAPVATPDDVVASKQFAARDYFDQVDDPLLLGDQPVIAPGPVRLVDRRSAPLRLGRAPRLGEHTDDGPRARRGPTPPAAPRRRRRAPAPRWPGIKVLDLTWAMAGPATTRVMADFGATVVRIENSRHLDVARTVGPFVNDTPGHRLVRPAVQHDDGQAQPRAST